MRQLIPIVILGAATAAVAQTTPSWKDAPALVASAAAPAQADLLACVKKRKLPFVIPLHLTRAKDGTTKVGMPVYGVGYRGFTDEERCLGKAVGKITQLPELPADIDSMLLGYAITNPATTESWGEWRDPAATIATFADATQRAALAACDTKKRTVRVTLDIRKNATRIWLPAWQFHSSTGDGTTPPAEAKVKACINKVIRTWKAPLLPTRVVEIELALPVAP